MGAGELPGVLLCVTRSPAATASGLFAGVPLHLGIVLKTGV